MTSVHNIEPQIEAAKNKIRVSNTSDYNKEVLFDYENELIIRGYAKDTVLNKFFILPFVIQNIEKDFNQLSKQDVKILLRAIETHKKEDGEYWAESTKFLYKSSLRGFLQFLFNEDIISEPLDDIIKTKLPNTTVQPHDILTEDEVNKLIDACQNFRDKAMISLLYDLGLRISELLSMKMKNYIPDCHGAVVTVSGKTGTRTIRVDFALYYLRQWVSMHPNRNDPEAYLWCSIRHQKNRMVSYPTIQYMLKKCAEMAGIQKRVHAHLFRHSSVTKDACDFSESLLKQKFGWKPSSNMLSRYSHLNAKNLDSAILKRMGIVTDDKKRGINKCPNCNEVNPQDFGYCGKCGYILSDMVKKENDNVSMLLFEKLMDDPDFNNFINVLKREVSQ
ncbi:tyrosine-type recombinase/integrase [Methanococcoides sp. SA1]|nr:tyrosine-type recombinase/integrase [Methanococcoides sp. SA1]